jgi:hypothetical protein
VVIDVDVQVDLQDIRTLEFIEDVDARIMEYAYPFLSSGMFFTLAVSKGIDFLYLLSNFNVIVECIVYKDGWFGRLEDIATSRFVHMHTIEVQL